MLLAPSVSNGHQVACVDDEITNTPRSKPPAPETSIRTECPPQTHAHEPQVRNVALGAIILVTFYVLLQSFHLGPHQLEKTTRQSLQAISQLHPEALFGGHGSKVVKVTSVFGQANELYEGALRSHEEHNRNHGYEMKVLREKIVSRYWSKPMYLLSTVVEELAKDEEMRAEWLMWCGPDVIILNPHVPVESFLPPGDFNGVGFLGTRDSKGFNGGVFFLKVHDWSVKMLVEVLNAPHVHPDIEAAEDKGQAAFDAVLRSPRFRDQVTYQPRLWYNAYQVNTTGFEGVRGDLLVHFHDIGGDKWTGMADTLAWTAEQKRKWTLPFEETTYEQQISDYWDRLRESQQLMKKAHENAVDDDVRDAARRMQHAITYTADDQDIMREGIKGLRDALNSIGSDKVT